MILPFYMRIKIKEEDKRGINLYMPMILIYLILIPFILLALPFWLIYSLAAAGTDKGKMVLNIVPAAYIFLCSSKGTEINVKDKKSEVILKII